MATYKCESCPLREKYEINAQSLIGRFWRWHINFCPGWRAYFIQLSDEQKRLLREKYSFTKYPK